MTKIIFPLSCEQADQIGIVPRGGNSHIHAYGYNQVEMLFNSLFCMFICAFVPVGFEPPPQKKEQKEKQELGFD